MIENDAVNMAAANVEKAKKDINDLAWKRMQSACVKIQNEAIRKGGPRSRQLAILVAEWMQGFRALTGKNINWSLPSIVAATWDGGRLIKNPRQGVGPVRFLLQAAYSSFPSPYLELNEIGVNWHQEEIEFAGE